MKDFSTTASQTILDLARRYDFSVDAVESMLRSVADGHGRMAQFDRREFGGYGQWMRGGMTMVSHTGDASLKERIAGLCEGLSALIASEPEVSGSRAGFHVRREQDSEFWPADLGRPDSAGSQNGVRYAYFAAARRLAIEDSERVTVYDTLDHEIHGVAQQQAESSSLRFSSQRGVVDVRTLPIVATPRSSASAAASSHAPDVVSTLERLAELRLKGVLTENEFAAKKTELLGRL